MKKIISAIFALALMMAVAVPGQAYYDQYKQNIKDGIGTFVNSPRPMVDSLKEEYKTSKFKPFGVFGGFLKGGYYMLKDMGVGLFRVVTFNVGVE